MNSDIKKFNREIQNLKHLASQNDMLTEAEFAENRQRVVLAVQNLPKSPAVAVADARGDNLTAIVRQAAAVLLGLSLIGGTAFAASGSIPGDALYPVKRATEAVRLNLTFTDQDRANLQAQFAMERIKELGELKKETAQQTEQNGSDTALPSLQNATVTNPTILNPILGTTPQNPNPQIGRSPLEMQARTEAGLEVSNALSALQKIKTKLEAQGNSQAASAISQNIIKLQTSAQSQDIKIDTAENNNPINNQEGGRSESGNATGTPPNGNLWRHNGQENPVPPITPPKNPHKPQAQGTPTPVIYQPKSNATPSVGQETASNLQNIPSSSPATYPQNSGTVSENNQGSTTGPQATSSQPTLNNPVASSTPPNNFSQQNNQDQYKNSQDATSSNSRLDN